MTMKNVLPLFGFLFFAMMVGCQPSPVDPATSVAIHPEVWPQSQGGAPIDPAIEARIDALMAQMTLEEKVAQTIQADINSITPDDIRRYPFGSILNGGNSAPGADVRSPAESWLALADAFYEASMDTSDGRVGIPLIWGTDAVHGQSNIVGATVFPHNIGLGATRNADLMLEIGRVTATEMLVTGFDWTFAPTLAVVRDDRWGRTYESYSENPEVVAAYAPRLIEGLQGKIGTPEFLSSTKIIATAKHFVGDGGTDGGVDQGDNTSSEADLRDIQAAGYWPAIDAGVQVIMASFNSWHGRKLHGHEALLTDVLKDRVGFNGFIVGDWNGHGQVQGCSPTDCPASMNAGLDMYMAPDSWRGLYENTLAQAQSGEIPMERLEDAVRRILRVKLRAGVLEKPKPSERPLAGDYHLLGAPEHQAVARQAVRESLVLLKNQDGLLPLRPDQRILVAGDGADDIGKQSGGWTFSWQGTGNTNADFPGGQSIWDGIREAVQAAGGEAILSVDGSYTTPPDAAIVVFGEDPYAEFQGDIPNVDYQPDDGLALLQSFREAGIPTVAVFLSGRPLWVNPELNTADAFVAAWLPGSEGGGVADVLLRKPDGTINFDFKGTLPFSWPRTVVQTPINVGDEPYEPLFAYGFGFTYEDDGNQPMFSEDPGIAGAAGGIGVFFAEGQAPAPWTMLGSSGTETVEIALPATSLGDALTVRSIDRNAQEDAIQLQWSGSAEALFLIEGEAVDLSRESNGDMAIAIEYRVDTPPEGTVSLVASCGSSCEGAVDMTPHFASSTPGQWLQVDVLLRCLAGQGADMAGLTSPVGIRSSSAFTLSLSGVRLVTNEGQAVCPAE